MCPKKATSTEHVPPKCIFPEAKDFKDGKNYRNNLITVPSCDIHNLNKSKDDEYLLYLLSMNIESNDIALKQFRTKVLRAIDRNSSLFDKIFEDYRVAPIYDQEKGRVINTAAFNVDTKRLRGIFDHIARGIYFHHFAEKWLTDILIIPSFIRYAHNDNALELTDKIYGFTRDCLNYFKLIECYGENQDIFKYQIANDFKSLHKVILLTFYGSTTVICCLGLKG
jgi:hypothetical protein